MQTLRMGSVETKPPISCADCKLGNFAVYGSTWTRAPGEICIRRKHIRTIAQGKTLFRQGEKPLHCYTLYSGWAFSFKTLSDGRRQILSFLIPGDAIILENLFITDFTSPYFVKSLTNVVVCTFSTQDLSEVTRNSEAQLRTLERVLYADIERIYRMVVDIGRRSALGRVAKLIMELESRLSSRMLSRDGRFDFPLRQEHIADAVGLTTVHVNRTLNQLRQMKLIAFARGTMTILNFPELKALAEEE